MLSKEEIEKILEQNEDIITYKADKDFRCLTSSEKTLLENNKKIKKYIDQLEADNYETNNIISEYIDERHNLIDIMKADRMEQLDDYVIYIIEKYLKELGALEDE